jgi:SAM-dependent methyltransferase
MALDGHLGGYLRGGDPATWCPLLWSWLVERFSIRSVLDIGCGEGHSTKFFHDLGCDVLGLEGSQQAIDAGMIPERVVRHDFRTGPFVTDRSYDMVWSCEFLEHVDETHLGNVLDTISCAGRLVAVTHAFPGQTGHHHVNCRPSGYWIRKIEGLGFDCRVRVTRDARNVTFKDYPGINHFARSGLVFVRTAGARPGGRWASSWKELRLGLLFRLSPSYRAQRRLRRALRRRASRSGSARQS